jgi:hypothetical protein
MAGHEKNLLAHSDSVNELQAEKEQLQRDIADLTQEPKSICASCQHRAGTWRHLEEQIEQLTQERDKLTEDLADWKCMLQESRQMHWNALGQLEALRAALRNPKLIAAVDKLLSTEAEVAEMPREQADWFNGKPGHADAFNVARTVKMLMLADAAITSPDDSVVREDRTTQSNQQHRTVEESSQVQAGTSPAPAPQPKDGFDGWIVGNNYRRRGRVIATVGKPNGEPWYEADDGTKWSAYDVRFKPDEGAPAPEEKA